MIRMPGAGLYSCRDACMYVGTRVSRHWSQHLLRTSQKSCTEMHDCLIDQRKCIQLYILTSARFSKRT